MALSILDGNQSATTLSTILSSGQHITAHTVVSLGTQAITDMRGAVSGSVVSISNLPSTQTIAGTVTANVANAVVIGVVNAVQDGDGTTFGIDRDFPISGTVTANLGSALPTGTNRIGVVTIGGGTVTIGAGTAQIGSVTASISGTVPVSISSVTVGNSITIGSCVTHGVTIANTSVTVNGTFFQATQPVSLTTLPALVAGTAQIGSVTASISGTVPVSISSVTVGNSVTIGSLPAISGTVTANAGLGFNTAVYDGILSFQDNEGGFGIASLPPISGTVTASVSNFSSIASDGGGNAPFSGIQLGFSAGEEDYRLVDPSNPLPVTASGTVTANSSNGSLTTRFGSVTTANTAFATSAVTNTNRKYLLIQNITTASNVITVGIGFTPTTTQGIQLFAGAGLTFEGSYIPTGAVNLLSSVTASCYTILEA